MCEHAFVPTARAFHDRFLELLPVYTEAGQRLVKLDPSAPASDDQSVAYGLADRACRSWLRGAIPPTADMLESIVSGIENLDPVTDPSTAMDAVERRPRRQVIAAPLSDMDDVFATARLAEECARAAARRGHAEVGRLAADCLYGRRAGAREEYVLGEAATMLGRQTPERGSRVGVCSGTYACAGWANR